MVTYFAYMDATRLEADLHGLCWHVADPDFMVPVCAHNVLPVWADSQAGDNAAEVAEKQLRCLETSSLHACALPEMTHFEGLSRIAQAMSTCVKIPA